MKTVFDLHGHTALITGSSKGIGYAIGTHFQESGAEVIFHGSSPSGCPDEIDPSDYIAADLLTDAGPVEMVENAFELKPKLDTLIANAGSFFDTDFLKLDRDTWQKTMRLNVEATFLACQTFARKLVADGRQGSIVIVLSTNGFHAEDASVAYDTSKGALNMLTRSLSVSLARHKIRVNGVAPGLIRTPLTESTLAMQPKVVAHYNRKILLERIGDAEDCAGACGFLVSEAAGYVTGHVIVVDGGLTVGQVGRMEE